MGHWNEICCAVDFTDPSRAALERAVELARRLDAALTLRHVRSQAFPGADLLYGEGDPSVEEEPHNARLDTWRAQAERELGRSVRVAVLSGNPAREIARFADHGVDMLVVGTRGPTGLGRLVLGSVAEKVVRDATCPVLVVHRPAAEAETSIAASL